MPDQLQKGAAVDLRGVVKRYGEITAVRDISLRIEPGEFLTLLGPSGSGKTTTLNLIAGFTSLTDGEIWMDGSPIEQVPPHRRNIGMIFQNYALFPHMTAFANVAYPLKQRKVRRTEVRDRVQAALDLVGLPGVGNRYPRQLSGGQQQRVAFARAIVFNPRILLMDEPLGALDRKLRDALQGEIKRIHRELGITFVYVTHDQEEALALSDRIALFDEGAVEQIGTPSELYNEPATRFVADFIGDSNVFEGPIRHQQEGSVIVWNGVALRIAQGEYGAARRGALVLRPHQIELITDPSSYDNVLRARVVDLSFLGAGLKLELELEAGGRAIIRHATTGVDSLAIGDRVTIGWCAGDGIVLLDTSPGHGLDEEGRPSDSGHQPEDRAAKNAARVLGE